MEKEDELFIMSVFLRIGKRRKKVQTEGCLHFLTLYIWNCILNLLYLKQLFCGFPSLEISLLRLVASCTNLFLFIGLGAIPTQSWRVVLRRCHSKRGSPL